jgi:hypothetical protein
MAGAEPSKHMVDRYRHGKVFFEAIAEPNRASLFIAGLVLVW